MTIDPAAEFLLDQHYPNLYIGFGTSERDATEFVCKGCCQHVHRWQRESHWKAHRRAQEAQRTRARKKAVEAATERLRKARERRTAA